MIAKQPSLVLKLSNSATLTFKGGNGMKKLATVVFAMLLAGSLAFAQDTGKAAPKTTPAPTTGKKTTKTSKAHKGGKKGKKSTNGTTTPAPK
jgi:hypothetical protein